MPQANELVSSWKGVDAGRGQGCAVQRRELLAVVCRDGGRGNRHVLAAAAGPPGWKAAAAGGAHEVAARSCSQQRELESHIPSF